MRCPSGCRVPRRAVSLLIVGLFRPAVSIGDQQQKEFTISLFRPQARLMLPAGSDAGVQRIKSIFFCFTPDAVSKR